jgi:hypothetical protein
MLLLSCVPWTRATEPQLPCSTEKPGLMPLASITLATSSGPASRVSSSARAVRSVPALRAGSNASRSGRVPGSSRRTRLLAAPVSSSSSSNVVQRTQQRQGKGLRPWQLPLAAAVLALHVARAAAKVGLAWGVDDTLYLSNLGPLRVCLQASTIQHSSSSLAGQRLTPSIQCM